MKLFFTVLLILAAVASGCTTRSQAKADARMAYLAGQKDAYASMARSQRTSIVVIGQVQNREIPWTDGMTLAQAIVAANYTGHGNPTEIILLRRGESASIDPADLLRGHDVPLEPGDTITLR
ncbi:MAG TPA: hypothetical protein VHX90_04675 [Verrucomicrobiae bacterium]|jgi:hypothetical protein|nr:hypothetical protein [Verrucomicrobiae bacterium]